MGSQKEEPVPPMSTSVAELLQAQAELWCHTYGYLRSMALHCAVKLGIPDAISRCGVHGASLSELHAALPAVAPSKRPCLARLMRFLAATGIFREDNETVSSQEAEGDDERSRRYSLTAVSRLLLVGGGGTCLSPFVASNFVPAYLAACLRLEDWLQTDDGAAAAATPFAVAHGGANFWAVASRDAAFREVFNAAMGSDSRFVAGVVIRQCREAFAGLESLVDVGGGDGTMARAVAEAFPGVRCSVLELPEIVRDAAGSGGGGNKVEFVAGDMMEFIPPADALLLKFVLHDWSDEDCVRILKRCREAVASTTNGEREPNKGKVIVIDTVVGSTPESDKTFREAQLLMDLSMMVLAPGKERDEEQWSRLFVTAGFGRYEISPVLGCRSLIEVYP